MVILLGLLLLLLSACPGPRDQVVLLPDDAAGMLAVTTARATSLLSTPYDTATVRPDGRVRPGLTTPAQVQARFGAVLATLPVEGRVYTLYFATGTTVLTPESQADVPALLAEVVRREAVEVEIAGHTDTVGDLEANDRLSLSRAEAVRQLLVQAGLRAPFVRVVGRGERAPAVATPDETAEPANRRVMVTVR